MAKTKKSPPIALGATIAASAAAVEADAAVDETAGGATDGAADPAEAAPAAGAQEPSDRDTGDEAPQEAPATASSDKEPVGGTEIPVAQFPLTLTVTNRTCMQLDLWRFRCNVAPYGGTAEVTFESPEVLHDFYVTLDQMIELHKWSQGDIALDKPKSE